mgnify:CR=1 FL=1
MPIAKRPNNIVPIPLFNLGVIMVGIKFPKPRIVTFHKSPLCHGERPRGGVVYALARYNDQRPK